MSTAVLVDELLAYLFDGQPHVLAQPLGAWLTASRRFTAFVDAFRTKVRKKIRVTQETESLLDLRLELETAYRLLEERSLSLVYEPPPSGKARGPDFAVSFTTSTTFMVEVTRLRIPQANEQGSSAEAASLILENQLIEAVCSKLGQMVAGHANILLLGVEGASLTQETLRTAMLHLQQRAERNDPTVVQRHGFRDRSDFFGRYQRLSELLVRDPQQVGESFIGWLNPQAKHPLPGKVRTALYRSLNMA